MRHKRSKSSQTRNRCRIFSMLKDCIFLPSLWISKREVIWVTATVSYSSTKKRCKPSSNSTRTTQHKTMSLSAENWTTSQLRRPIKVRIVFRHSKMLSPKKESAASSRETQKTYLTRRNLGSPKYRRLGASARFLPQLTTTRAFPKQTQMEFSQVIVKAIRNTTTFSPWRHTNQPSKRGPSWRFQKTYLTTQA